MSIETMKVTINVTDDDIEHGEAGNCNECPVAIATKRAVEATGLPDRVSQVAGETEQERVAVKTKRKPQERLAAGSQMNCSSSLKLSPEQQMILRILNKCEEGRGLLLDRKAPKAAAQLEKWRFIEGIPNGNGERIYVIVERGRMALKKAEKQMQKQAY